MEKFKEVRNMTVYNQCGYNYKSTPTITLKGQWLKDLGFDSGMPIEVKCEDGKLTIIKNEQAIARMVAEPPTKYKKRAL